MSRREWLGKLALPATGAVIAAGLLDGRPAAGARKKPPANNDDLGARVYNIRSYGAKGDKTTVDTAAVQAAIDACTGDGGGTVLVPAGTFTIGTVELKSNVTLHIAAGNVAGQRRRQAVSRGRRDPAARRHDAQRWKLGAALCREREKCDH